MKYFGNIINAEDLVTKQYADQLNSNLKTLCEELKALLPNLTYTSANHNANDVLLAAQAIIDQIDDIGAVVGVRFAGYIQHQSLHIAETLTLTPVITPANALDQTGVWASSDPAVATVDNGLVTGIAVGDATITFTTTDGAFIASCEINVSGGTEV